MEAVSFKAITEAHLQEVLDIYNYYVIHTTVSFHTEPLQMKEMRENVIFDNSMYKAFIIELAGAITGYILINQHKKKQAYDVSGEVTIYLKPEYTGQGMGRKALRFIEQLARERGFHVLIATICGENEQSKHLFEKHGYSLCAHYKEIGYKFGRRLDVVAYQKIIS